MNKNNHQTPSWLIETQNKSWEPEILISGLTLTFIFILSDNIYNFYGMLTQDFGAIDGLIGILHAISVIMLTGLKFILIFHLILRGLWTGLVGLSYVYPKGVNKEKLPESDKKVTFLKPEELVIQIEKVCSLLFSFIFSSVSGFLTVFILYSPTILFFMVGLSIQLAKTITTFYILILVIFLMIFTTLKKSKVKRTFETTIFNNILVTFATNLGKKKTRLLFGLYFILIFALSVPAISDFGFRNRPKTFNKKMPQMVNLIILKFLNLENTYTNNKSGLNNINKNHYQDLRNTKLRVEKATIDKFRIKENTVDIFIANYKEDEATVKMIGKKFSLYSQILPTRDSQPINLSHLYNIYIDDNPISQLNWYTTENISTKQKGIFAAIPLDNLESGYHKLMIDKVFWRSSKKKFKLVEDWEVIPFEKWQ